MLLTSWINRPTENSKIASKTLSSLAAGAFLPVVEDDVGQPELVGGNA